jgi:hypothetical protein
MIEIAGAILFVLIIYGIWSIFVSLAFKVATHTYLKEPSPYIPKDYDLYCLPESEAECKARQYAILNKYQAAQYKLEPLADKVRLSREQYHEYLMSPEWKHKRNIRLGIDNHICQYCGSSLHLREDNTTTPNVHHYHYDTLTKEDIVTDLVSLCNRCHDFLHSNYELSTMEFLIKQNIANKSS